MTLVSDTHSFVFVHVPKTGGTSVRQVLADQASDQYLPFDSKHKHVRGLELRTAHPYVPLDTYFTFAFVRNPYDQLASYWTYKMENPFHTDYAHVASLGSFATWLEWAAGQSGMRQSSYTHDDDDVQIVDFVGRFEHLHADLAAVCMRLGLPEPNVGHHNRSDRRCGPRYDASSAALVRRAWARDFALFGYSDELPEALSSTASVSSFSPPANASACARPAARL